MPRKFDLTKIETINLEKKFRINEITAKKMAEEMSVIVSHLIEHKNSKDTKKLYDIYNSSKQIKEILPKRCICNSRYGNWNTSSHFDINTILKFDKEFRCAYDIITKEIKKGIFPHRYEYFFYKLRLICNYLIDVYKFSYVKSLDSIEETCLRVDKNIYDLFKGNALYVDDEYIYVVIIIRLHFFLKELNEIIFGFPDYLDADIDEYNGVLHRGVEISEIISDIGIKTIFGTFGFGTIPTWPIVEQITQPQPDPLPTKETTPTTQQEEPKTDPIPETPQPEPQPEPQPITTNKTISHVTDILESKYIDDNTYTNIIEKMCKEGWITKISENQYIWNKLQNQFIRFIEWFHEKGMISVVESDEDRRWQEFCNDFKFKSQKGPKDIIATKLTSKYSSKIGYIHGNAKREIDDFLSHLLD